MRERDIVVILSVCLSHFDFGNYWQQIVELDRFT